MALIDPDSVRQRPDIPDLDLPVEISAEQSQFDHGLTAADMVSDHVRFRTPDSDDGVLNIEATGDTDETELTLTSDDVIDHTSGDGDSLFDLSYLSDVFGPINKSDTVTVELGEEFPIKIHTSYADGLGNVTFMVAPRITDD
jgi:proliferating cell nuclear antigen